MQPVEYVQVMSERLEDVIVGSSLVFTKTISESDVYMYAGITGDFSPNHINAEYMKDSQYGERIAHGALLIGLMGSAAAKMRLGRTVSLGYDKLRFIAPVRFGDTITTEYVISEVDFDKKRIYNHGQMHEPTR